MKPMFERVFDRAEKERAMLGGIEYELRLNHNKHEIKALTDIKYLLSGTSIKDLLSRGENERHLMADLLLLGLTCYCIFLLEGWPN